MNGGAEMDGRQPVLPNLTSSASSEVKQGFPAKCIKTFSPSLEGDIAAMVSWYLLVRNDW